MSTETNEPIDLSIISDQFVIEPVIKPVIEPVTEPINKREDRKALLSNIMYSIIAIVACLSFTSFILIIFICSIISILSPLFYKKNPLDNPFLTSRQRLYLLQKKN